jgi:hypothetical protein
MPGKLAAIAQLAKLDGLDKPTKENIEHSGGLTLEALINASYQPRGSKGDDLENEGNTE